MGEKMSNQPIYTIDKKHYIDPHLPDSVKVIMKDGRNLFQSNCLIP
jgi:hypothetical protein